MLTKETARKRIRNFFLHPLVNIAEPLTEEGTHNDPLATAAVMNSRALTAPHSSSLARHRSAAVQ